MGKADYQGFMKITDRAIQMLVAWKKIYLRMETSERRERLLAAVEHAISELAEYRFELKNLLKGNEMGLQDKLSFLLEEIEKAKDGDTREFYIKKLEAITKQILADGLLEEKDGNN